MNMDYIRYAFIIMWPTCVGCFVFLLLFIWTIIENNLTIMYNEIN